MAVTDVFETEVNLKGNVKEEAAKNNSALKSMTDRLDRLNRMEFLGGWAARAAAAAAAVTAVGVALGAKAMNDAAQFESMIRGLEAIEGSADNARKALERLEKIAKAPGVGYDEAIRGFASLRRAGLDQERAFSFVAEAGNVNATAGGNSEQFARIMLALGQIAAKPKLSGEELLQLVEAGVPVHQMLKAEFGTSDTDALRKAGKTSAEILDALLRQMQRMPRVAGGAQNVFENIGIALRRVSVEVGTGLNAALIPGLERFSGRLEQMIADGTFTQLGEQIGETISKLVEARGGFEKMAEAVGLFADATPDIARNLATIGDFFFELGDFVSRFFDDVPNNVFDRFPNPAEMVKRLFDGIPNNMFDSPAVDAEKAIAEMANDPRALAAQERLRRQEEENRARLEERKKQESERKSPAVAVLEKIEHNTRQLPDLQRAIFGGGELGRLGVTAVEVRGKSRAKRVARDIEGMAVDISSGMPRKVRRGYA